LENKKNGPPQKTAECSAKGGGQKRKSWEENHQFRPQELEESGRPGPVGSIIGPGDSAKKEIESRTTKGEKRAHN